LWDNEESLDSNYNGADVTVNKRMSDGWSLMAGASFGKSIGDVLGGDLNNPNSSELRRGRLGNDVPWSYRLSGVYDLPYRIASVSGTMQYYKGVPESTTVSVGSGAVPGGLTQVTQSLLVEPRGDVRLPNVFSLDISLRKSIRRGSTSFEPRLDFYNLTNEATVTNWLTTLGSTYHRASTIQAGRMIKAGLSVEF
jgi:outer membrane receptor protein involved in Fe transport